MAAAGSVDESTNGPEVFSELREQLVQIAVLFASLGEKEQKDRKRNSSRSPLWSPTRRLVEH